MLIGWAPAPVSADDPPFLTIGAGYFDFNRQKDTGGEFRLDYRSDYKLWHFKPLEVVRWFDPSVAFPEHCEMVGDLRKTDRGRFGVHIWNDRRDRGAY